MLAPELGDKEHATADRRPCLLSHAVLAILYLSGRGRMRIYFTTLFLMRKRTRTHAIHKGKPARRHALAFQSSAQNVH